MDPFDAYIDTTARDETTTYARSSAPSKGLQCGRLVLLQRVNTACRLVTFVFTLAAVFCMFFAKGSNSYNGDLKIDYKQFSSFQFFLFTNCVVCVYALAMSVLSFVLGLKRTGQSAPDSLKTVVLALNALAAVLLLLAFAAATATEVISRNGWRYTSDDWTLTNYGLCQNVSRFCATIEAALAFTGVAILSLLAGCVLDLYYIFKS